MIADRLERRLGNKVVDFYVRPDATAVEKVLRDEEIQRTAVFVDEMPSEALLAQLGHDLASDQTKDEGLYIQTSGTTGKPKMVFVPKLHLWDSTKQANTAKIWGLTFPAFKMAGLQLIAQAIASGGAVVEPESGLSPMEKLEVFSSSHVQAVSATPSFWRLAIGYSGSLQKNLEYISLGGEVVDQKLLDTLKNRFWNAKISHIYATSETGSVFAVGDGLAGFPRSYAGKRFRNGKTLKVVDGEILVGLPHAGGEFVRTGDQVRVVGDRYFFDGRTGSFINVGGNKVSLTHVETLALEANGVADCQAFGVPNPFTGHAVALQVVWDSAARVDELLAYLRSVLDRNSVPVKIETVNQIILSDAQKKVRKSST